MTISYVSGSRLQHADACEGSCALPTINHASEKADAGSAGHEHLRDRTLMLPGDAQMRVSEHAATWGLGEVQGSILAARARSWEWTPPPGTLSEVALGLMADGHVERVTGGRGTYQGPPEMRVATRVDAFWSEPDPLVLDSKGVPRCPPGSLLWGIDCKWGSDTWVAPVEHNLQALCAAILPAIWTGARRCVAAIVFPAPGPGEWDVLPSPLDEAGIARGRDILLAIAERANAQRARHAQGLHLKLTEGPHCTWCDSAAFCPAKLSTLKSYLGNPRPFDGVELTAEEAERLAELLPAFERFADSVKGALTRRVKVHGQAIPLKDGTAWGPYPHPKKTIATAIGYKALVAHVGDERAQAALKVKITDAAIREAVKGLHKATGVEKQGAATVRAIYRDIRAAGGLGERIETWWGRHRPALPEATGGGMAIEQPIDASVEIEGDD